MEKFRRTKTREWYQDSNEWSEGYIFEGYEIQKYGVVCEYDPNDNAKTIIRTHIAEYVERI